MKKIFSFLAATAASLLVLSCTVDSLNKTSLQTNKFKRAIENLDKQKSDSIPKDSGAINSDGPGDEVFPIKPPKKMN